VGKSVVRLVQPTGGRIRLGETGITQLDHTATHSHRRRLQIVFQNPYASLNPRLPAGDIIAEPLENYGLTDPAERQRQVQALLEKSVCVLTALRTFPLNFQVGSASGSVLRAPWP